MTYSTFDLKGNNLYNYKEFPKRLLPEEHSIKNNETGDISYNDQYDEKMADELKKQIENAEVARNREREYPPIQDGLDAFVKYITYLSDNGDKNIPDEVLSYVQECNSVKKRYPIV